MDCTGSMGTWINAGKDQIISLTKLLHQDMVKKFGKTPDLRVSFIGYKDHCDGDERLQHINFGQDINLVHQFVSKMRPRGGGDCLEGKFFLLFLKSSVK